jgi:GT2 family glycosyltransferase
MKEYHKIIFVILVYENTGDLEQFIHSVTDNKLESKIIVVNSYYDEKTNNLFALIAKKYTCDYVVTENKGYGAGNNRGIEYARNNYDFEFLIISNPDIEILSFDSSCLNKYPEGVIGPVTKNQNSNNKNPYWYLHISFFEWLLYISAKRNKLILFYLGIFLNKCIRIVFQVLIKLVKREKYKVFALQGTFLIFRENSLNDLGNVFDEDMFLFAEEAHLAHLAKSKKVKMFLDPDITVFHKQGGSSSSIRNKLWKYQRQSIIVYYEKWHKNVGK